MCVSSSGPIWCITRLHNNDLLLELRLLLLHLLLHLLLLHKRVRLLRTSLSLQRLRLLSLSSACCCRRGRCRTRARLDPQNRGRLLGGQAQAGEHRVPLGPRGHAFQLAPQPRPQLRRALAGWQVVLLRRRPRLLRRTPHWDASWPLPLVYSSMLLLLLLLLLLLYMLLRC